GLTPNTVYYVVCSDTGCPNDDGTYTFQVSTQWLQSLSNASPPVPIQGPGGNPGPSCSPVPSCAIIALPTPAPGASPLQYGPVKPVTQLGSSQLAANQLALNPDGSVTLWFGPALPAGAPASNWIPTPNTAYYSTVYPENYPDNALSTQFQVTLRTYYPQSGNTLQTIPSILPCTADVCGTALRESYIPPAIELVQ